MSNKNQKNYEAEKVVDVEVIENTEDVEVVKENKVKDWFIKNKNKVLIGAGVVAGAIAYAIIKSNSKDEDYDNNEIETDNNNYLFIPEKVYEFKSEPVSIEKITTESLNSQNSTEDVSNDDCTVTDNIITEEF